MSNCDKCGKKVLPENDMIHFLIILGEKMGETTFGLLGANPRHLLPEGGCQGSPSRAQYIEGQPRDTRGYGYYKKLESMHREAYAELLKKKDS